MGDQQMTTQLITPTPDIPCQPGWCLQYVRQTYGLPGVHPTATAAWLASPTQHPDQSFPAGCAVPVWFSLEGEPAGHVALMMPDASVYSTSDLGTVPHHHPSLADLLAYYAYYGKPLTYLGWTEDIEGVAVVSGGSIGFDSIPTAPAPAPQEDTLSAEEVLTIQGFINSLQDNLQKSEEVTQTQNAQIAARLDKGIVISRAQAEDIVAATVARLKAAPAPAVLDVNALAAQLAPLLNASLGEQFIAALRTQINK
jgi:hypothetical protein